MELGEAAAKVRPGTAWNVINNTLYQADDGTPRVSVPTTAELKPFIESDLYKALREKAYPSIGDQLDALWKGGDSFNNMKKVIDTVKTTYPKP